MITITSLVNRHKNHLIQAQKKERKKKKKSFIIKCDVSCGFLPQLSYTPIFQFPVFPKLSHLMAFISLVLLLFGFFSFFIFRKSLF